MGVHGWNTIAVQMLRLRGQGGASGGFSDHVAPAYTPRMGRSFCLSRLPTLHRVDVPVGSDSKESAWSAGEPGSIPGSGRSPREGNGNALQDSWASLVAQLVKNLPAMWETWVRFLGQEDPLETGKATHFSILDWRIPCTV